MKESSKVAPAGEAEPFIPYVQEKDYPANLRHVLDPYSQRMGFVPNALKFYMHRPEIAEPLWQLQHVVLRGASSTLDRFLKRKLSLLASATNGCAYCTAHHCSMLTKPRSMGSGLGEFPGDEEGWDLSDEELQGIVSGAVPAADEFEKVCFDYVRMASVDPNAVSIEMLERLKRSLTPPQIVELACLVGFWKFYNTVHDSLNIPVESELSSLKGNVEAALEAG